MGANILTGTEVKSPEECPLPADKPETVRRYTTKSMLERCHEELKSCELKSRYNKELCFCHNDLVIANVIFNRKADSIHFIDFEYGGWNYPAWEIGNHFNEYVGLDALDYTNNFPSEQHRRQFLSNYLAARDRLTSGPKFTADDLDDMFHDVSILALQSHLQWVIWAFLQDESSSIDFDYKEYGRLRLQEMLNNAQALGYCFA